MDILLKNVFHLAKRLLTMKEGAKVETFALPVVMAVCSLINICGRV